MSITKRMLQTGCFSLLLCASPLTAQEKTNKSLAEAAGAGTQNVGTQKVEPGIDDVKKLANSLNELRTRVDQLEASITAKPDSSKMTDTVKWLQTRVESLQDQMLAMRNTAGPVTQASTNAPKPMPPDDFVAMKTDGPVTGQDALMRRLEEISRALQEMKGMKQQVDSNSNAITDLRRRHDEMLDEISKAINRVGKLEQDFVRMRSDARLSPLEPDRRVSAALPMAPDSPPPPVTPTRPMGMGTIRLVNTYVMPVNVVVDGRPVMLSPGQSMNMDRPAGNFTYEVVGIQGNALRTLNPNETLTIQVYPR
jgi:hypothetical protein